MTNPFKCFSLQLRLISYSSVDSFIKRDYVLDILDKYKVNPKILERLQNRERDRHETDVNIYNFKLETKRHLMNKEKGCLVQHRREYYNDFEDCLRDYKNAKIKSLQKQTKVHLSDGDNGDSDSEYVDCTDSNDLKNQSSTLSSKSMPQVPTADFQDNLVVVQQLEQHKPKSKPKLKPKRNEKEAQTQTPQKAAQLNTNYDVLRIEHETLAQLTSHNNDHNQIIDINCNKTIKATNNVSKVVVVDSSPKRKSIPIDEHVRSTPSTSIVNVEKTTPASLIENTTDKQSKSSEAVKSIPVQIVIKKDDETKRKSCKKKQDGGVGATRESTRR